MSIHKIPVNKLSPEALQGVINEFISRDGTDYGEMEVSPEIIFRHVKKNSKPDRPFSFLMMRLKPPIYSWLMTLF